VGSAKPGALKPKIMKMARRSLFNLDTFSLRYSDILL
jgi:hypothetical protein